MTTVEFETCGTCSQAIDPVLADPFPVLKIRADGPCTFQFTELSLGGHDLLQLVTDITLKVRPDNVTTATLTFEVTPDVEVPAEIQSLIAAPSKSL